MNIHLEALQDLVERTNLAGAIALIADSIWIIRDISTNGFTVGMLMIAALLFTATGIMLNATVRYHLKTVRKVALKMKLVKATTIVVDTKN